MLRSFRVANHKSFRDEAELLLLPAYDKSRPVVPVAGVFGANASGKSNLLDALRWLQTAVRASYAHWEPGSGVPRTPFRLDPEVGTRPSLYCVEMVLDGLRHTYGLEVDDDRVVSEWLYTYPRNRRRVVFEREQGQVRLGSTVPDYRSRGDQLSRQTRDNALFLSVAAHNDLVEVQPVYNWFRTRLRFADGAAATGEELLRRLSDSQQRAAIVELIRAADVGITDLSVQQDEEEALALWRALQVASPELRERAAQAGAVFPSDAAGRRQAFLMPYEFLDPAPPRPLRFHHGASRMPLHLDDQSAGTRSWIGLVSAALEAITGGALIVVDEIDASLHPHLTARLINLFRDTETNPMGAQLLFTTHDATLLDEDTLDRDEVWFVEKDPDSGNSRLYPLTDFKPRTKEDREGRYMAGSYGAVPVVADHQLRRAVRASRADDAAA